MTDEAKDFLIFKGYNPDYGARPLRRAIENLIENPLAEEILRNAFKGKDLVNVTVTSQDETKRLNFDATTKREQEESQARSSRWGAKARPRHSATHRRRSDLRVLGPPRRPECAAVAQR